jgi:hypothetical protein
MRRVFTVLLFTILVATMFLPSGIQTVQASIETGWPVGQPNTPRDPDDIFIDFEGGIDGAQIQTTIPSIRFTTTNGLDWAYCDIRTGQYNVWPEGQYVVNGNFCAWLGIEGAAGRIDFVGGGASYMSVLTSTYSGVQLDAYDINDNYLSSSGSAGSNLDTGTFTRLTVDAPEGKLIAYVMVHDSGNYWEIDDLCTDANRVAIPVPGRPIGSHNDRIDLVFVPDDSYGSPEDIDTWLPTFLDHINHQIDVRLGGQDPVTGNLGKFNFYYTRMQGTVDNVTDPSINSLPPVVAGHVKFADAFAVLHTDEFGDACTRNRPYIYSAEGPLTFSKNSFIHESGHGIFELADEYDCIAYNMDTKYFEPNPKPNIWDTKAAGRTDASGEYRVPVPSEGLGIGDGSRTVFGPVVKANSSNAATTFFADTDIDGDVDNADVGVYLNGSKQGTGAYAISTVNGSVTFVTAPPAGESVSIEYSYVKDEDWNPLKVWKFTEHEGDWWKLGTTQYIMYDGPFFTSGWGKPGARRVQWVLDHIQAASTTVEASPQAEKAIWLNLHVSAGEFSLLEDGFVADSPPNYFPGEYDFAARVFSTSGEFLGEYGINDPRGVLAESGYLGPTWRDSVNFPLILPYFNNGGRVDLVESATGDVMVSVDISEYATKLPPVADDQTVFTWQDEAVPITLDATDADGDSLTYAVVDGPAYGTLSGTAPTLTYTPEPNFYGTDSFTYQANDGTADSNVATITVRVCPPWDINKDGKVDYKDLAMLGAHYGETTSLPYPAWDINKDGKVDYKDLAILGAHYGEVY